MGSSQSREINYFFLLFTVTEYIHDPVNLPALKSNGIKTSIFTVHCQIYLNVIMERIFQFQLSFFNNFGNFWCSCYSDICRQFCYIDQATVILPQSIKSIFIFFQKSYPSLLCVVANQNKPQKTTKKPPKSHLKILANLWYTLRMIQVSV